jgi:F-type H+-transporting ATPase subunit gamma
MSRLREMNERMRSFQDIGDILSAMKNLSVVEIAKLSRFCQAQDEIIQTVRNALIDFQRFYEYAPLPQNPAEGSLYILLGSERGFCGGFNEVVQKTFDRETQRDSCRGLIVVGHRLAVRFQDDPRVVAAIEGPGTTEDIPRVISQLINELARYPASSWKLIYNRYDASGSQTEVTSFSEVSRFNIEMSPSAFPFAPLLNLPPSEVRPLLVEQYLFALFYGAFYLSFMAENHGRLRHMDGALDKIREAQQRMHRLSNSLRQEIITEELELILLNVEDLHYGRTSATGNDGT